jgi:hypothetical protein
MNKFLRNPCRNSKDIFGCFFFLEMTLVLHCVGTQQLQNDEYEEEAVAPREGSSAPQLKRKKMFGQQIQNVQNVGIVPPLNVGTNAYPRVWQPQSCGHGPPQGGNWITHQGGTWVPAQGGGWVLTGLNTCSLCH